LWRGFELGDHHTQKIRDRDFEIKPRNFSNLETILNCKRFSSLVCLGLPILNKDNLEVVKKNQNITCLEFYEVNEELDKEDFAEVLVAMQSVSFYDNDNDVDQLAAKLLAALFKKMVED